MKKKIFLITAMVALLICVFAISVSAANEVTLVGGEKADFETVFKVGKSGGVDNVVTGFNAGYNNNSMTDVIFPDYIVGIECNGLFGKYANPASTTIRTLTFEASDEFFISGDNIFAGIPVTKVTFNPDCVVEMRKGGFTNCSSLAEITFPKFRKLSSSAFANCSSMVSTNELAFADDMTEIGADAFNGCAMLGGTIVFPSTLTTIKEEAFSGTSITGVDFSRCADLATLEKAIFAKCDSLQAIDMSACVDLTSLGNSFAENCDNLASVILPPNLETINEKSFAWCCKLQSMVIPASCTLIGVEAFQYARRGQELQVFTLYIQSNVNFDTSRYSVFNSSGAKVEFILIGENITAESFIANNSYTHVTGATVVDYLDPQSPWTYTPGSATTHTIVENYCKPFALTGEHANDANPCVLCCEYCELSVAQENPIHNEVTDILYDDGYDKIGVQLTTCTNRGCKHEISLKVDALFICKGYSAPENGAGGIAIDYVVNTEAMAEYERVTNVAISYGIYASTQNNLGSGYIFDEKGTVAEGALTATLNKQYTRVVIKLVGFDTDELKATKFAIGAYVKAIDGESLKISYLQSGEIADGAKYAFVSFNDIVNSASSGEENE